MRKQIILFIGIIALFMGCGLDKQAKELRALENCRYEFLSADSIFLAGTDISRLIGSGRLDVGSLPGVALGFLSQDILLSGLLQVRVTNPTKNRAGIQQFAYKILIEDREVMDGTSDLPVVIPAGETVIVPVKLQANVYPFLSDTQTQRQLLDFLNNVRTGQTNENIKVTLKIKPTLALGNKQLNYPGYITVDKEIDGRFLVDQQVL